MMTWVARLAGGAAMAAALAAAAPGWAMTAHDFDFTTIEGKPLPMAQYAGKVVLLVNTASFCGFTPQYEGLEALWQRYRDRGLVVLGVPSNDFGNQEPGDEGEIKAFCEARYQVDFPMTTKQHVTGADAHPLYRWITDEVGEAGAPRWNFHKYLIGKDGALVETWPSQVTPLSDTVIQAVETEIDK
jgi:glutathione peroxidase